MTDENEDYAWRFTGIPYLDGIIFGAGVPRNKQSILINVSYCSYLTIEDIEKRFDEAGYDVGSQEMPNGMTKETDLRLAITGAYPIFTAKTLPRFRERRLIIDETPIDFIKGLFTVSSKVKLGKHSNKTNFKEDAVMVRSALPTEDILQLLLRIGVTEYRLFSNRIILERDMFVNIEPFEKIYQEYLQEEKLFSMGQTREELMEERMDELQKEMWADPKVDTFDDSNYEYDEKK